jgi:hypothetical protein
MKVGVAHTTGLGLDQDLTGTWSRNVPFLLHQGLPEVLDDGDVHFTGHG